MASDGTRVFVLGGYSYTTGNDKTFIHGFDTKDFKYPEPEPNAVNDVKATQLARKSPMGASDKPRRFPEGDISEGSTEYHAKFAPAPHSSEGEATRLEFERQLSERDQHIARLTEELAALKSALLEQAEAKAVTRLELERQLSEREQHIARLSEELAALKSEQAVETARRLGPEPCQHADDRRLMLLQLIQRNAELVDTQARIGQYRAELEAKESELEAVRLRLTDAETGLRSLLRWQVS